MKHAYNSYIKTLPVFHLSVLIFVNLQAHGLIDAVNIKNSLLRRLGETYLWFSKGEGVIENGKLKSGGNHRPTSHPWNTHTHTHSHSHTHTHIHSNLGCTGKSHGN